MASPPSDPKQLLTALLEAAHQGDWSRANRLTDALASVNPPSLPEELAGYLEDLRRVLIAAKASRSHLALKLNRIRAAAKFLDARKSAARRHDFADSADS